MDHGRLSHRLYLYRYRRRDRLHVLHNWGWDEATACPSSTVTDMLGGGTHTRGEPVTLGAWDVRLFRQ